MSTPPSTERPPPPPYPPPPGGPPPSATTPATAGAPEHRPPGPVSRIAARRSLAGRVTLLTTMAVGLAVVIMAAGAYITIRVQLQHENDQSLLQRDHTAARAGVLAGFAGTHDVTSNSLGSSDVNITVLYADGSSIGLSKGAPALAVGKPELAVAAHTARQSVRTIVQDGVPYRVVAVQIPDKQQIGDSPGALIFAKSLVEQNHVLNRVGVVSLVFGLAGVVLAGLAGFGVARGGLRPVRRLTFAVEDIARTEDLRPLPVEGDDEIARLATAFNQMLSSLDASRERQRRLVTDAGHELRTPLTSLRTNIDLLTQSHESNTAIAPAARAELLSDIAAQIDELTTLIGDLTELARDEPLAPVVGSVDVGEIVDVSVARVRRRAPGVTFDVVTEPWSIVGEAPALERAITNLLDNAAKYGPSDGTVTVRLHRGRLVVDDEGPGIAEADRSHVFDRFWRSSEARTLPGSGLGLSIVSQIVERHSGTVTAESAPGGGARIVVQLPGLAGSPRG